MKNTPGKQKLSAGSSKGFGSPRGFGSPAPGGKGGFGGFAATHSKSGLAYLADRHDPSAISDPNVIVAFKNLLKKDGTTKARALEELVSYAQAHPYETGGGAEEAVLEAWIQFYPRLSIDDSRKVRELSHTLQFELMKSARKRMEKHIPKIVGPWLAGTYDRDRAVSKAASDGLSSFLNTEQKELLFWKRLQPQILEYATEALKETPTTLSDMRSSNKEEAELKYYRVVYGSLSLVLAQLQQRDAADIEALSHEYEQFFSVEAVWRSAVSSDSNVRKAAYSLFWQCLDTRPALLETQLPRLTKLLTQEAPKANQTGSVVDYVKVLTKLSAAHPEIWRGSEHPFTKLRPLLEKGSQGVLSTPNNSFWKEIDGLFASVPTTNIPAESAKDILESFRAGVSNREEPRGNAVDGWTAYLSMVRRMVGVITPENGRVPLVEANVHPLFEHFIHVPDKSVWTTGAYVDVLTRASLLCSRPAYPDIVESTRNMWSKLSAVFAGRIANSLPEVSKDFQKSQQDIAKQGDRWFDLLGNIHRSLLQAKSTSDAPSNLAEDVAEQPTLNLLQSAADLLKKRNYKPFGAAHLLRAAFSRAPYILQKGGGPIVESLFPVDSAEQLSLLLSSPSASELLSCLRSMAGIHDSDAHYISIFTAVVSQLLAHKDNDTTAKYIALLVTDAPEMAISICRGNSNLQEYLEATCFKTAQGKTQDWDVFTAVVTSNPLAPDVYKSLTTKTVHALGSPDANSESVLRALEIIAHKSPAVLFHNSALHLELVTKLIGMMEIGGSAVPAKAIALRALLESDSAGESPVLKIIQENLDWAGPESLGIDTLIEQASGVAKTATEEEKENLFPNTNRWMEDMLAFLGHRLSPALSLTSNISGAYLLVPGETTQPKKMMRDRNGNSVPARMAAYTTKLLGVDDLSLSSLPQAFQVELVYLLYLVIELGSDHIAVADASSLWGDLSDPSVLSTAEGSIISIRAALTKIVENLDEAPTKALSDLMLRKTGEELNSFAVYTARALSDLLQTRQEGHGFSPADEDRIAKLDLWKGNTKTALGAVAVLTGYSELLASSKTVSNFCNRLISDIAGAKADKTESTLTALVLLNACMAVYEVGQLPTATNRLVFAVKQITSWFGTDGAEDEVEAENAVLDARIAAESCRALQRLLPCIKDIYGPYWERSLKFCIGLWNRAAVDDPEVRLPYVHASLKLVIAIEAIEEPNDDLQDAISMFAEDKSKGLLNLLALERSGGFSQPQEVVDSLLCRMVSKIPLEHIKDPSELYSLVASGSREIQTAAFNILHRAIPAEQAEYSLNVILEKKEARLPDELLSLLLDAPTLEAYPDDVLVTFPNPVRSYLLSWHLVFDAFSAASAKVRTDYVDQLGSAGHVGAFLDFAFDVLGHSAAHPLNLDKEGLDASHLTDYDIRLADAEPEERNMHWLLVHLYYLTLKYLPGLFKAWYAACRSKQTKVTVEAWTAKSFSTLLINEVLDEVAAWAAAQEASGDDDDKELLVRVSRPAREVVAGYEVDELQASIAIRLPANYPIDAVTVVGVNRVAVSEKKWQSWLMITQGVIAFSNGSVVDGLATFRRNVLGALKGQTECAICYSIISADKKMPDKRCGTCKNLFHRTCLYKWFQTSNQNTCPLCRNPISFLGSESRVRRGRTED